MENTKEKYAIIGAGPAGLAGARNLQKFNIGFDAFEGHSDVGGLWDIENSYSTVYKSAHLISSKRMTEFAEFPMGDEVADYPHHTEMKAYFCAFAKHFDLYKHYHFNSWVEKIEPNGNLWDVTIKRDGKVETHSYKGVLIANGLFSKPNIPDYDGEFTGELLHSCEYKSADIFEGKRVLVIGAGNTGCDVVVDAIHRAQNVALSVRRGYHFVPKYVFGKPADAIGGKFKLPKKIKQRVDSFILKFFTGDPEKFGFPKPDHKLYETHPIVNSLVLHHLGHGDLSVKTDIEKFAGKTVHFKDGSQQEFDIVLLATGYKLNYPFIKKELLNWNGTIPKLYLNIFHPEFDNLFVLGMVEATGLGWEGRYQQAELVARYIKSLQENANAAQKLKNKKLKTLPDMRGGFKYMEIERMSFYVHKETYLKALQRHIAGLT